MKLTVLKNHVPIDEVLVDTPDPLERYEIFVGRSEDCHVRIDDPLISRHHFVLKNQDGNWTCEKKTQLGAVTINGQAANKIAVSNNDEIKCGLYSVIVSDIKASGMQTPTAELSAPDLEDDLSFEQEAAAPVPEVKAKPKAQPKAASAPEPEVNEGFAMETDDLAGLSPMEDDLAVSPDLSSDNNEFATEVLSVDNNDDIGLETSNADSGFDVQGNDDLSLDTDNDSSANAGSDYSSASDETENAFSADQLPSEEYSGGEISTADLTGTRFDRNFINYQLKLFGEHAPYDRYQMVDTETFIGRDPKKCQIILNDPEVSNVHAVIKKSASEVTIEDLNSSNGTILNGERINRAHIATGDEFVIGSTSFTLEARSELLDAESDRLMPVARGQTMETEEVVEEEVPLEEAEAYEAENQPQDGSLVGKAKAMWKNPQQRKKLIYGGVVIALLLLLLPEEEETVAPVKKPVAQVAPQSNKPQLSKELETRRNVAYELGFDFFNQRRYNDALREFQIVADIDPNYKQVQSFLDQTKQSLKALEQLDAERRAAEERVKTKKIIEDLLVKAREAVKERQVTMAESYFGQITEKDPENIEVQQLKMELEAWQREDERKRLEEAAKAAARKSMVDALAPGKTAYIKKEWYRAILKLEDFLRKKGMDEDLVKEASDMLSEAKNELASELGPVIGKARSLKEGQDLKAAYESFLEVLRIEPTNTEALNEVDDIKTQLDSRSKRVYREAIIAESLSLFNDAKEKFQEVQQISPTDSEYYKKASDKLKNYLE